METTGAKPVTGWPRWRAHKKVWAFKIDRVEQQVLASATIRVENVTKIWLHPVKGQGSAIDVDSDWVTNHGPVGISDPRDLCGGYFVKYKDGYTSWSPGDVFEDGYVKLGSEVTVERSGAGNVGVIAPTPTVGRIVHVWSRHDEHGEKILGPHAAIIRRIEAVGIDGEPRLGLFVIPQEGATYDATNVALFEKLPGGDGPSKENPLGIKLERVLDDYHTIAVWPPRA